jgi:hypothetical protein
MSHEPSNHEPDIDPQGLWQSQKKEYDPMTLADIHMKATALEKLVHRRNAREYVAQGMGIVAGSVVLVLPNLPLLVRAGGVCWILGMVFIGRQLHRRTAPEATPHLGESLVDAYRRQLIRQRDAGRTHFSWYLLPMIPGPALMMVGVWLAGPKPVEPVERLHTSLLIASALIALTFLSTALYIQWGVRRLQKMIDEL